MDNRVSAEDEQQIHRSAKHYQRTIESLYEEYIHNLVRRLNLDEKTVKQLFDGEF